jgi:hypothetical protein
MSRSRISSGAAVALALAIGACGGGGDGDSEQPAQKAVEGTFVGKVKGEDAFVAVVAAPTAGKGGKRDVSVYVTDGRRLSEWFPGSVEGNSFKAASADQDAEVNGKLTAKGVTGTLELPGGKKGGYEATPATGAAGLYDLSVSAKGRLSGASAAGIGLKGRTPFTDGTGTLELADGKRRKFEVRPDGRGAADRLRAGQVLLIVLGGGELSGAGKGRTRDGDPGFFIRSSG